MLFSYGAQHYCTQVYGVCQQVDEVYREPTQAEDDHHRYQHPVYLKAQSSILYILSFVSSAMVVHF